MILAKRSPICRDQKICGQIIQKWFIQSLTERTAHHGKRFKRYYPLDPWICVTMTIDYNLIVKWSKADFMTWYTNRWHGSANCRTSIFLQCAHANFLFFFFAHLSADSRKWRTIRPKAFQASKALGIRWHWQVCLSIFVLNPQITELVWFIVEGFPFPWYISSTCSKKSYKRVADSLPFQIDF